MLEKKFYHTMFSHSFNIPVRVDYWDHTEETYGTGEPTITIKMKKAIPVRDLLKNASLALGEAYMRGDIEVLGGTRPLQQLIAAAYANAGSFMRNKKLMRFLPKQSHTEHKSKEDIHSHYDLGNDFYKLWLDPTLTYSCAYFEDWSDDLETAQLNKIDHILRKLNPQPGRTLLDIGCGWGGLAHYMASNYDVSVVGVTISAEQQKMAQERCEGLDVTILLQDYRDLNDQFDRIVSVGMFEHVGPKNYDTYFAVVDRNLKPEGIFLLHTIGSKKTDLNVDPWINKYIFPNGCLPSVRQIAQSSEPHFVMEDWHNFGADYDTTLMAWYERFLAAWPEIADNYSERFKRMFTYYLNACAGAFRARDIQLWQVVFSRGVENGLRVAR